MPQTATMNFARWRLDTPFAQAAAVCAIMFCCTGMNCTVLGLGAGGSRVENLPFVNTITATGLAVSAVGALFAGPFINKLGPRNALLIGTISYPTYVAALWLLDHGMARWYGWVASILHGAGAALLYPAGGYIVASYSVEGHRGRYVTSMWCAQQLGYVVGSAIILGITSTTTKKAPGVPTAVYASIVAIESLGVVFCMLIKSPDLIRRKNGQPIAVFISSTWREEMNALFRTVIRPETLLLATSLLAGTTSFTFMGSLNSFFFSARTRALGNFCYSTSALLGGILMAVACDWSTLGNRRRRSLILSCSVMIVTVCTWAALFWFINKHSTNRKGKGLRVDWSENTDILGLLGIFVAFGFAYMTYLTFHIWLWSSMSNVPSALGRSSGYLNSMRFTGLAIAFGLDSHRISFNKEAQIYFCLIIVGGGLALFGASRYMLDTKYGLEEFVVIPDEATPGEFVRPGVRVRKQAEETISEVSEKLEA